MDSPEAAQEPPRIPSISIIRRATPLEVISEVPLQDSPSSGGRRSPLSDASPTSPRSPRDRDKWNDAVQKATFTARKTRDMVSAFQQLNTDLEDLEEQLHAETVAHGYTRRELEDLKAAHAKQATALANEQELHAAAKARLEQEVGTQEDSVTLVHQAALTIQGLREDYAAQCTKYREECAKHEETAVFLEQERSLHAASHETFRGLKAEWAKHLEALTASCASDASENRAKYDDLVAKHDELLAQHSTLQGVFDNLQGEHSSLRDRLEHAQQEAHDLWSEHERLSHALEKAQQDLGSRDEQPALVLADPLQESAIERHRAFISRLADRCGSCSDVAGLHRCLSCWRGVVAASRVRQHLEAKQAAGVGYEDKLRTLRASLKAHVAKESRRPWVDDALVSIYFVTWQRAVDCTRRHELDKLLRESEQSEASAQRDAGVMKATAVLYEKCARAYSDARRRVACFKSWRQAATDERCCQLLHQSQQAGTLRRLAVTRRVAAARTLERQVTAADAALASITLLLWRSRVEAAGCDELRRLLREAEQREVSAQRAMGVMSATAWAHEDCARAHSDAHLMVACFMSWRQVATDERCCLLLQGVATLRSLAVTRRVAAARTLSRQATAADATLALNTLLLWRSACRETRMHRHRRWLERAHAERWVDGFARLQLADAFSSWARSKELSKCQRLQAAQHAIEEDGRRLFMASRKLLGAFKSQLDHIMANAIQLNFAQWALACRAERLAGERKARNRAHARRLASVADGAVLSESFAAWRQNIDALKCARLREAQEGAEMERLLAQRTRRNCLATLERQSVARNLATVQRCLHAFRAAVGGMQLHRWLHGRNMDLALRAIGARASALKLSIFIAWVKLLETRGQQLRRKQMIDAGLEKAVQGRCRIASRSALRAWALAAAGSRQKALNRDARRLFVERDAQACGAQLVLVCFKSWCHAAVDGRCCQLLAAAREAAKLRGERRGIAGSCLERQARGADAMLATATLALWRSAACERRMLRQRRRLELMRVGRSADVVAHLSLEAGFAIWARCAAASTCERLQVAPTALREHRRKLMAAYRDQLECNAAGCLLYCLAHWAFAFQTRRLAEWRIVRNRVHARRLASFADGAAVAECFAAWRRICEVLQRATLRGAKEDAELAQRRIEHCMRNCVASLERRFTALDLVTAQLLLHAFRGAVASIHFHRWLRGRNVDLAVRAIEARGSFLKLRLLHAWARLLELRRRAVAHSEEAAEGRSRGNAHAVLHGWTVAAQQCRQAARNRRSQDCKAVFVDRHVRASETQSMLVCLKLWRQGASDERGICHLLTAEQEAERLRGLAAARRAATARAVGGLLRGIRAVAMATTLLLWRSASRDRREHRHHEMYQHLHRQAEKWMDSFACCLQACVFSSWLRSLWMSRCQQLQEARRALEERCQSRTASCEQVRKAMAAVSRQLQCNAARCTRLSFAQWVLAIQATRRVEERKMRIAGHAGRLASVVDGAAMLDCIAAWRRTVASAKLDGAREEVELAQRLAGRSREARLAALEKQYIARDLATLQTFLRAFRGAVEGVRYRRRLHGRNMDVAVRTFVERTTVLKLRLFSLWAKLLELQQLADEHERWKRQCTVTGLEEASQREMARGYRKVLLEREARASREQRVLACFSSWRHSSADARRCHMLHASQHLEACRRLAAARRATAPRVFERQAAGVDAVVAATTLALWRGASCSANTTAALVRARLRSDKIACVVGKHLLAFSWMVVLLCLRCWALLPWQSKQDAHFGALHEALVAAKEAAELEHERHAACREDVGQLEAALRSVRLECSAAKSASESQYARLQDRAQRAEDSVIAEAMRFKAKAREASKARALVMAADYDYASLVHCLAAWAQLVDSSKRAQERPRCRKDVEYPYSSAGLLTWARRRRIRIISEDAQDGSGCAPVLLVGRGSGAASPTFPKEPKQWLVCMPSSERPKQGPRTQRLLAPGGDGGHIAARSAVPEPAALASAPLGSGGTIAAAAAAAAAGAGVYARPTPDLPGAILPVLGPHSVGAHTSGWSPRRSRPDTPRRSVDAGLGGAGGANRFS